MNDFKPKEKKKNYSFTLSDGSKISHKEYPSIIKRVDKLVTKLSKEVKGLNRSQFISTVIELALNKYENRTNNRKPNRNSN